MAVTIHNGIASTKEETGHDHIDLTYTITAGAKKLVVFVGNDNNTGGAPNLINNARWDTAGVNEEISLITTFAGSVSVRSNILYLDNPTPGVNKNLRINFDAAIAGAIGALTLVGCEDDVYHFGSHATSVTVNSLAGGMVLDCATYLGVEPTITGGQTQLFYEDVNSAAYKNADTKAAYEVAVGASTNVAYNGQNVVAASFIPTPVVGGNQVIWIMFERMKRFYEDLKMGLIPPQDLLRRRREVFI